jgi:hypothetical protein
MLGGSVGVGVDGYRANAKPSAGPNDATGNFAAIGDQDLVEHAQALVCIGMNMIKVSSVPVDVLILDEALLVGLI